MQLIPGVLLGQNFGQTLLEKNADRHMLRQGAQRMLQLPPVVLQFICRQRMHRMNGYADFVTSTRGTPLGLDVTTPSLMRYPGLQSG